MSRILMFFVLMSLVVSLPVSAQPRFKDVPDDHWAADAVYDLVQRGVTEGFPDGTYKGKETLTRYQNAAFISRLAKSLESKILSEDQVQQMIDSSVSKAIAEIPKPPEVAEVSGTVFVRYINGIENSPVINNFDIDRAYVTIKKSIGDSADAKVVLDSGRQTGKLDTFLKYAYVDLKNILKMTGFSMHSRIGMQPTYWSAWVDNIVGLRVVASSMVGLDSGVTTSDFGVGGLGTVNLGEMLSFNYLVTALNGAGFDAAENNVGKNFAARVDSEIMPGLIAALGAQIADVDTSDSGARLGNVLLGYKTDLTKAYIEMVYGSGTVGYSASAYFNFGALEDGMAAYGLFARGDVFDPNRDVDDDGWTRYWVGGTYDWNKNVKLVLDYEAVAYEGSAATNPGQTVSQIALRTQINL